MRRVVPLRPSETNLLVTYDNDTFEREEADTETGECKSALFSSSSSCNLKGSNFPGLQRRRSSTNFSVTFREDKSSPILHQKPLRKLPPSVYPEFTEVISPSSRSSLWTSCSFRDDGDSTSFNFSDGTHGRATSSLSSSSSSSITYDPRGSAFPTAISSIKDSDALPDTANSSSKDIYSDIDSQNEACKGLNPATIELRDADVSIFKPPLKPLQISIPELSILANTPIFVIPRKVQEDMHNYMDISTNRGLSHCSLSSPKVSRRSHESCKSCQCLPRSIESSSNRYATSKSPQRRKATASCSSPFKYLTKCLGMERSSKALEKESRNSEQQSSSPAKFSTLMNQLYSPRCCSQGKLASLNRRPVQETEHHNSSTGKDVQTSSPRLLVQKGVHSQASDMINDYVRHIHEVGKLPSFRKAPKSASFHYDSKSSHPKGSKQRHFSMDFATKPGKGSKLCSYKPNDSSTRVDRESPDLFVAEEKNSLNLALLRVEISKLCKEKRFLARELAAEIKARLTEQKSAASAVKHMEAEMEKKLISLEKDHACAQACLEKEIDTRKKEWSAKLVKIRVEEKRLRDRVSEMALERVELQKAIALYKGREASLLTQAKDNELSVQVWMRRHCQNEEEAVLLRQSFANMCDKLGDKEHELDRVLQRSKVLERENAELLKEFSRLRRSYAEQEITFEELWQRLIDIVNGPSDGKLGSLRRLHSELKVFALREQALRYEIGALQSELLYTQQKNFPVSEDCYFSPEGNRMPFTKEHPHCTKKSAGKHKELSSLEAIDDLAKKLELAKQETRRVEHQLEVKEEEVELLQSTLEEREHVVKDLQDQLTWGKVQRDGLRKQVQQMSHEALQLTLELTELRKVVEKLDDELMLKEGQISILRDACSDSGF